MSNYYKGIAFPFGFGANGGVKTSILTHEEHDRIYQSIYQILFTFKRERINNAEFGSRLKAYLFESFDDINTKSLIKFEVEKAITEQEPRVEVLDVRVYTVDGEEGKIFIDVDVLIIQFSTNTTLSYQMDANNSNV